MSAESLQQLEGLLIRQKQAFFVYDQSEIQESAIKVRKFLSEIFPNFKKLYFSVKSNPCPFVLQALEPWVDGFDVSSRAEMQLLTRIGVDPRRLTWSGPAKTEKFLASAVQDTPQCVHLDSFDEFQKIQSLEAKVGKILPLSLRVTYSFDPKSKLGVSDLELAKFSSEERQRLRAIHFYLGREKFNLHEIIKFFRGLRTGTFANAEIEKIFMGPGLPPAPLLEDFLQLEYPEKDPTMARELMKQQIHESGLSAIPEIHFECGRALVQSGGEYFAPILAVKPCSEGTRIIVDGGLQHMAGHLASPMLGPAHIKIKYYRDGKILKTQSLDSTLVQGSLSIWNDVLHESKERPHDLRSGDWVSLSYAGAYGLTAGSSQFIGQPKANEFARRLSGEWVQIENPGLSYLEAAR